MKKIQGIDKEIKKLKTHLTQLQLDGKVSSMGLLLNHDTIIRKKMKIIEQMLPVVEQPSGQELYQAYLELLNEGSQKILKFYNEENETEYRFEEVIESYKKEYIENGILFVISGLYLPRLMRLTHLPMHPKDEYPKAREIKRKFFLHLGETNTGKTYRAMQRLKNSEGGIYLAPLRLLALENFERLNQEHVKCHLLTGEEEIYIEQATHVSCTIEKLNLDVEYPIAVIDEVQLIQDTIRGCSWTRAILGIVSSEIHLCGASNAKELLIQMITDCGDTYELIDYCRNTPLRMESSPYQLNHPIKGDALITFSKKKVLELSRYYQDRGYITSIIYGDLPPEVRRSQYNSFSHGESEILISTDAIGMGVNLPIRRIIFMNTQKFDGEEMRELTSQEVKQIAGRAGRKGLYDVGYVTGLKEELTFIKDKLECQDAEIKYAVIGPHESMLSIKDIPLIEKLKIWGDHYQDIPYYQKMDIERYLYVLREIKGYKLEQWIQWKIMKLPFNFMQLDLLNLLLFYIEEHFINGNVELTKPRIHSEELERLEIHYQEVNLYYAFSKSFCLELDINWVYRERSKVSKKLNYLLLRL